MSMRAQRCWVLCLFVGAVIPAGNPPAAAAGKSGETQTLIGVGDTALARFVHPVYYEKGTGYLIGEVAPLISGADIALFNLEAVVSSRGRPFDKGERRPYSYRGRPELLDIVTDAGFDVAVLANNHTMDFGPEALLEQLEMVRAAGMAPVGAGANLAEAATPTYVRSGDVVVAFIGMETMFPLFGAAGDRPGIHHALEYEPVLDALRGPVAEARKHAHLVVVSPHWGGNWTENPTPERRTLAKQIVDLGVDAILGHSAHQIHGVEIYKGKPIVYDMGSFLFDATSQARMRLAAAFILEFDKRGFTRLSLAPLLLFPNRVTLAAGADAEKVQTTAVNLCKELDPQADVRVEGDRVVLPLHPRERAVGDVSPPETVYATGQTRRLPDVYRRRKSNVVHDKPPPWTAGFKPVALENGVTILGENTVDAVWPRRAFVAEVSLKVPGPLKDKPWRATLKGVAREGKGRFVVSHPLADGAWTPYIWEPGEIGSDRTVVRPPRMPEGVYDLYWRMEHLEQRQVVKPVHPADGDRDGYVRVGEILITSKGIPSGPAGIAWDGRLPPDKRELASKGTGAPGVEALPDGEGMRLWPAALAILAILLVAAALALIVRARRRRSHPGEARSSDPEGSKAP